MGNGASIQERSQSGRHGNGQGSNLDNGRIGCGGVRSPDQTVWNNCHQNLRPSAPSRSATSASASLSNGKVNSISAATATVHSSPLNEEKSKEADQRSGQVDLDVDHVAKQRAKTVIGSEEPTGTSSPQGLHPQPRSYSSLTSGGFQARSNENSPRGLANPEARSPQASAIQKILESMPPAAVKLSSPKAANEEFSSPSWMSRAGVQGLYEREPGFTKRLGRVPNLNESGHSVKLEGSPSIVTPTYISPTAQLYQNILRDKGVPADSCSPKLFTFGLENVLERGKKVHSPEPMALTQEYMDQVWDDINRSFASLQEQTDKSKPATPGKKHGIQCSPVGSAKKLKTSGVEQVALTPTKVRTLNLLVNALEQVNVKITQKYRKEPFKVRKCQVRIASLQEYILQKGVLLDWDPNYDSYLIGGVGDLLNLIDAKRKLLQNDGRKPTTTETERTVSARRSPDGASRDSKDTPKPLIFIDPEVEHSDTSGYVTEDKAALGGTVCPDSDSFADDQCPRDPKDVKIDKYLGVLLTENWVYAEKIIDFRRQLVDMCADVQREGRSRRTVFGKQLFELIILVTRMNRAGWTVGSYKNVEPILRSILDQAKKCINKYLEEPSR